MSGRVRRYLSRRSLIESGEGERGGERGGEGILSSDIRCGSKWLVCVTCSPSQSGAVVNGENGNGGEDAW